MSFVPTSTIATLETYGEIFNLAAIERGQCAVSGTKRLFWIFLLFLNSIVIQDMRFIYKRKGGNDS